MDVFIDYEDDVQIIHREHRMKQPQDMNKRLQLIDEFLCGLED